MKTIELENVSIEKEEYDSWREMTQTKHLLSNLTKMKVTEEEIALLSIQNNNNHEALKSATFAYAAGQIIDMILNLGKEDNG